MFFESVREILTRFKLIKSPDFLLNIVERHPNPDELIRGTIFIVQNGDFKKTACFLCPGECGKKIILPLIHTPKSKWKVDIDWLGRPSIDPSIRVLNACRCHYWIRKGTVNWCIDNGLC